MLQRGTWRDLWWVMSPTLAVVSCGTFAYSNFHRLLGAAQSLAAAAALSAGLYVTSGQRWVAAAVTPLWLGAGIGISFAVTITATIAAAAQRRDSTPARPTRLGRWAAAAGFSVAVTIAAAPAAVTAWFAVPQVRVATHTFVDAPVATPGQLEPSPAVEPSPVVLPGTVAVRPEAVRPELIVNTPDVPDADRRVNVLLLGGDAGPGRWGLRTDSMNLVSIDPGSGDAAIIGIPRNLRSAPMPAGPLRDRFPSGYPDLLNALYGWGEANHELVRDALGPTDAPGASLVAAAAAELLGVSVHAWVLIDMAGFIEIIDAFGGVDVHVASRIQAGGNVPYEKHPVPAYFQAGWNIMDGTDALSYVRSRAGDSDYRRMSRQRCLLASVAAQNDRPRVAAVWPALSAVIADRVRTNLGPETLRALMTLAGSDVGNARNLALAPPAVQPARWDPASVRALVAATIARPGTVSGDIGPVGEHLEPRPQTPDMRQEPVNPDEPVPATSGDSSGGQIGAPTVDETCQTRR